MKCIVCGRQNKKQGISVALAFYDRNNTYQRSDYGPLCIPCSTELESERKIVLDTENMGRNYAKRIRDET